MMRLFLPIRKNSTNSAWNETSEIRQNRWDFSLFRSKANFLLFRRKGFGRIRMRHVPDASGTSLQSFICDVVEKGATIRTDGWTGYRGLSQHGYEHERTVLSASGDPAHVSMPGVHRIASLVKRWILGTHQGSIVPVHLQSYLEEFTFRFNRRNSESRGLVFRRLIEQSMATEPVTETEVTFGYDWEKGRRS